AVGYGIPHLQHTPWHVWRPVLLTLLSVSEQDSSSVLESALRTLLGQLGKLEFLALLNPVFQLSLPEHEATRWLEGAARAQQTRALLFEIVKHFAAQQPLLLFLEDAHWFDRSSWSFLLQLRRSLPQLFVFVTTRPLRASIPEAQELRQHASVTSILQGLSTEHILEMTRAEVGAVHHAEALSCWLMERSDGNPFIVRALLDSLQHLELWKAQKISAILIQDVELPTQVEHLLAARIDRLDFGAQLVLKSASVIGNDFTDADLAALLPEAFQPQLERQLQKLVRETFLVCTDAQARRYAFRHRFVQEAAYQRLVLSQKRMLHSAFVALLLQSEQAISVSLLAYHFAGAGRFEEAMRHFEQAGDEAYFQGAFVEAEAFFRRSQK
ncbi:MAG: hypothetical protein AAGJ35_13880, partial [Myxococcota bacterium]